MVAGELISGNIYPVKPSDKMHLLIDKMQEHRLGQWPVVRGTHYLGLVTDEEISNQDLENVKIKSLPLSNDLTFAYEQQHVYDVLRLFDVHQLDVLAVLNEKYAYLGVITLRDLVNHMTVLLGSSEVTGIIVLEVNQRDNALSHIAQIVESDNAQILSSYVQTFPDTTRMEITLKLNRVDIASIVSSFLRYDYTVKATYNDSKVYDSSKDRYDQLMNYLNM